MSTFKSAHSYWSFARTVTREHRYVHNSATETFLSTIFATSRGRETTIPKDRYLWRAQLGYAWDPLYKEGRKVDVVPGPYPPERMKPLKDFAREGRVNPKGIPYLYLSNRRETALARFGLGWDR